MSDHAPTLPHGLAAFDTPQQAFTIGSVNVGGPYGVNPTVMIGTIFYRGHDVESDADKGLFDEEAAAQAIRVQEDYSQRTGNPGMLDVVGATPEAMKRHLEFASQVSEAPLLIDGTTPEVRLAGLEYAAQAGISERIVYNSITPEVTDDELKAIQDAGVTSALILTYYMLDFTAAGRVQAVRELLPRAQAHGINRIIVDTCVLDMATLGEALDAMYRIKQEFGLPVGGGVHNAVAVWKGLKPKFGKPAKIPALAAACTASVTVGANFVLYGPVEDAPAIFPAVAMIDTATSQIAMERDAMPADEHPRYRIG